MQRKSTHRPGAPKAAHLPACGNKVAEHNPTDAPVQLAAGEKAQKNAARLGNPINSSALLEGCAKCLPVDVWPQVFGLKGKARFHCQAQTQALAELLIDGDGFSQVAYRSTAAQRKGLLIVKRKAVEVSAKFFHAGTLPFSDNQCNTIWLFTLG